MYPVSETYRQAIQNGEKQHIRGQLKTASSTIQLDDSRLIGSPRYEKRCTETEEAFGIGQLYTGIAEIDFIDTTGFISTTRLIGAELKLWFSAGESEEIPLGTWYVRDPSRKDAHTIHLRCEDCISKLDVPIDDPSVGWIKLASRMRKITQLTGVEFAQTAEEIEALVSDGDVLFETSFAPNCRQEICDISALIGGFACADREGRIEFRLFGADGVRALTADERHSATPAEYTAAVNGISYSDSYGGRYTDTWAVSPAAEVLLTVGVPYSAETVGSADNAGYFLRPAAENLAELPVWSPGEIQCYSDPSTDLGDILHLTGGWYGNVGKNFIVTADYWQFRAPQTLVSAGVESSYTGSSHESREYTQSVVYNLSVTESLVPLTHDDDEIRTSLTQRLSGAFSCRESTLATVCVSAVVRAQEDTEAELHVLIDGVMNSIIARESVTEGEYRTLTVNVPFEAASGSHTVTAETSGSIEIDRISGYIRGQGITEEQYAPMLDDDFEYTVSNGKATVTGYRGDAARVRIPAKLGGNPVTAIASGAFAGMDGITAVKIPDGVEAIG